MGLDIPVNNGPRSTSRISYSCCVKIHHLKVILSKSLVGLAEYKILPIRKLKTLKNSKKFLKTSLLFKRQKALKIYDP